ncbi:hypothetical protein MJ588_19485 [Klebsiella pneumoniae]|nr:hypothetical protein MJ588_19485 [Klebsiella pneumoniae]
MTLYVSCQLTDPQRQQVLMNRSYAKRLTGLLCDEGIDIHVPQDLGKAAMSLGSSMKPPCS